MGGRGKVERCKMYGLWVRLEIAALPDACHILEHIVYHNHYQQCNCLNHIARADTTCMRLAALAHGQLTDATASAADQAASCLRAHHRCEATQRNSICTRAARHLNMWSRFGGRGFEGEGCYTSTGRVRGNRTQCSARRQKHEIGELHLARD